jgi:hypothetical protein
MNGSGDVRPRANRIYDEAAAQVRSGQLSGDAIEAVASQIESMISESDNEVVAEEVRSTASALRELPTFVEMDRKYEPTRDSGLLDQADEIFAWGWGRDLVAEARLDRAQQAYRRLNALPKGGPEEEHAISGMINEVAERIYAMGGEA